MSNQIYLNPWNSKNKTFTKQALKDILQKARVPKYAVDQLDIENMSSTRLNTYQTALTHKSYVKDPTKQMQLTSRPNNCLPLGNKSYENQEFLGDRVLELSVATYIFERFPDTDEGFKTKLKNKLVRSETLGTLAKYLGLSEYILLSQHVDENCNGRNNTRILEDVFEAFVCALFQDFKSIKQEQIPFPTWEIVNIFVRNLIEEVLDIEEIVLMNDNYKDILLRKFQTMYKTTPRYVELSVTGPPHNRVFEVGVLAPTGKILSRGISTTKKQAEQEASKNALSLFDQ